MNRNFEFKQLLRAYRGGIIDEATFETEVRALENGSAGTNGHHGFLAFGKTYGSEKEAIVEFLDRARAGEAGGAEAFNGWVKTCKTECIYTGIQMIAEREAYRSLFSHGGTLSSLDPALVSSLESARENARAFAVEVIHNLKQSKAAA